MCIRPNSNFLIKSSSAFSLIEILLVIGIIGILATMAIPSLSSITQARGVTDAGFQVAAAIEQARAEAVSRRTFVWLGIEEDNSNPSKMLRVGMVFSKDGTSSIATNNLQPIGRALKIDRISLSTAAVSPDSVNLANFKEGASFSIGAAKFDSKRTITFTPMGEVTTNSVPTNADGFTPNIVIPLRSTRGDFQDDNNPVKILIDGSVGIPTIKRES